MAKKIFKKKRLLNQIAPHKVDSPYAKLRRSLSLAEKRVQKGDFENNKQNLEGNERRNEG